MQVITLEKLKLHQEICNNLHKNINVCVLSYDELFKDKVISKLLCIKNVY